jgi:sarcosine oxidase subunit alpha
MSGSGLTEKVQAAAPDRRPTAADGAESRMRIAGKGRTDPAKPVRFQFDGKSYVGQEGDTLASALLANGVHLVGRSFKYHRPRGILSAGCEEPNALVGTDRGTGRFEPNTRATMAEIFEAFRASSQNRWPSLERDVGAVNDGLYMLFSAGFYYKTFMWPKSSGTRSTSRSSAARPGSVPHPPSPIPTPMPAATPIATFWWSGQGPPASPRQYRPPAVAPG